MGNHIETNVPFDKTCLEHFGTPKHSGRYPWGSGDHPYQGDSKSDINIKSYINYNLSSIRYKNDINKIKEIQDKRKRVLNPVISFLKEDSNTVCKRVEDFLKNKKNNIDGYNYEFIETLKSIKNPSSLFCKEFLNSEDDLKIKVYNKEYMDLVFKIRDNMQKDNRNKKYNWKLGNDLPEILDDKYNVVDKEVNLLVSKNVNYAKDKYLKNKISHSINTDVSMEDSFLTHYGIPRRSGRYPWGSGKEPYQNTKNTTFGARSLTSNNTKEKIKKVLNAGVYFIPLVGVLKIIRDDYKTDMTNKGDFVKKDGPLEKVSDMKRCKKEDPEESMGKVNPNILCKRPGTETNCMSCVIAMDMRSKGYDVRARRQNKPYGFSDIPKLYKNISVKDIKYIDHKNLTDFSTPQEVFDTSVNKISKENNGNSSGIMLFFWKNCGGHAVYYKSKNGNVEFYDGQNNKKGSKLDSYFVNADPSLTSYLRTDNLELSENVSNCVVSMKE